MITADPPVTNHNETRHYRVKTVNGVGPGDPSNVVMATTHDVPPAPTGLAAVPGDASDAAAQQNERITVTWEQVPADNTDLPVTADDAGYILEWADDLRRCRSDALDAIDG